MSNSPVREIIYEFDAATREEDGIDTLPSNLGEAVGALEADDGVARALGPHGTDTFVEAKRRES